MVPCGNTLRYHFVCAQPILTYNEIKLLYQSDCSDSKRNGERVTQRNMFPSCDMSLLDWSFSQQQPHKKKRKMYDVACQFHNYNQAPSTYIRVRIIVCWLFLVIFLSLALSFHCIQNKNECLYSFPVSPLSAFRFINCIHTHTPNFHPVV